MQEGAIGGKRSDAHYLLGRTDHEYERLIKQAQWIGESTEHLLRKAGIVAGMRVLDVGCGVGDVSLLLAHVMRDSGEIVGIDQDPKALALARQRVAEKKLTSSTFVQGDFRWFDFDQPFDAVVGRYVLMYQASPNVALRSLVGVLKPGGSAVFQELDMSRIPISWPTISLLEQCFRWAREANRKAGVHVEMGLDLYRTFLSAGLTDLNLHVDTLAGSGPSFPGYEIMADSMRSILPQLERAGITNAREVGPEDLAQRIRDSVLSSSAIVTWSPIFGVWGRKPVGADRES
jgi:ubiquinone/menaquinone biosynthesis C-methylase UbiE